MLYFKVDVFKLGLYVSNTGNIHYGSVMGMEDCDNRIKPENVWIDEDGFICAQIERRKDNTNKEE